MLPSALSGTPLLGALAIVVWALAAWFGGGFAPSSWGPLGLLLAFLLAIGLTQSTPPVEALRGARLLAAASFVGLIAWSFLSILWADAPGDAWAGADKTLLYVVSFLIFALWPYDRSALTWMLGLFVGATAIVALAVLVSAVRSPADALESGRLVSPTGYVNATVALWMLAAWPAGYLASVRSLPALLRGASLGAAALFVDLAVLGQSRAWLFLTPVLLVAFFALTKDRLRLVPQVSVVALATFAVKNRLLDVFHAADTHQPVGPAVDRAAAAIAVAAGVVAVLGAVWAAADRRVTLSPRVTGLAGAAVLAVVGVAAAALIAVAADRVGDDPHAWAVRHWRDFAGGLATDNPRSRFGGSLGTDRYQEWRIAWIDFRRHPVQGIGAENYGASYLEHRVDSLREPQFAHSTVFALLAELGFVGAALFAVGVVAAVVVALRRRADERPPAATAIAAALLVPLYWLAHGAVDWFWQFPALAAPAFGFLGLAASSERYRPRSGATRRRGRRQLQLLAVALLTLVVVAVVALPSLSRSYQDAAVSRWRTDPARAYRLLDVSARLDPLTAQPLLLKGSIALRLHQLKLARRALRRALSREPENWYVNYQLALVDGSVRRFARAGREIRSAQRLNPRDPVVILTRWLIERHRPIEPNRLNGLYVNEFNRRFGLKPPRP
jgi:O-Antigen ligase